MAAREHTCQVERLTAAIGLLSSALVLASCPLASAQTPQMQLQARVISCPVNEEGGPSGLKTNQLMPAPVQPQAAARIAYYEAVHSPGVFAPKGWFCRSWYGASGSTLVVTPRRLQPPYYPLPMISGPAVMIETSDGATSGRFHVAIVAAQLFPVYGSEFIAQVRQEHLLPDSTFDARSYPDDRLSYLSDRFVEYTTPANHAGIGTDGLLQQSGLPISGLSILTSEAQGGTASQLESLTEVQVRVPPGLNAVSAAIMRLETACVQLQHGCQSLR